MADNQKKWLGAAYKKNNLQCQQEVSEIWKKLKNQAEDLKDLENAVDKKISEWKVVEKKQKNSLTYFWGKASQKHRKKKQVFLQWCNGSYQAKIPEAVVQFLL